MTAMHSSQLVDLEAEEEGRRLCLLRIIGRVTQEQLAAEIGYQKGGASSLSRVEKGYRVLPDKRKKRVANFLAAEGELVSDADEIFGYLTGLHHDLRRCIREGGGPFLASVTGIDNPGEKEGSPRSSTYELAA